MGIEDKRNTILIVGDWVVDEYWFLVRHHSDISSFTGFVHYRLMSEENDIVMGLCGAGHVARLLYHLRGKKDLNRPYRLAGMGLWNIKDTDFIAHLMHTREPDVHCLAAKATFCLTPQTCDDRPDVELFTLDPNHTTIRVIRSYHGVRSGLEQINRMDWELERPVSPDIQSCEDRLPRPQDVAAIVVYDLKKGAITPSVISQLRKRYPDAPWYVKIKELAPQWLELLGKSLNLLVIGGPEVAALRNPWDRWLVNSKVTLPALEIIDNKWAANTVLLSDSREVIARVQDSDECFTTRTTITPTPLTQLGWSSALFSALVFRMVQASDPQGLKLHREDMEFALDVADEQAGVPTPGRSVMKPTRSPSPVVVTGRWTEVKQEWKQATRSLGLIGEGDNLRLDVWRGSIQIPGYIACIQRKREIIDEIGQRLRAFNRGGLNNQKSTSILLQADPGSGKSYLAKLLAKVFNFQFLGFDITQMVRRDELLDVFDMVATQQANSNNPLIIFVDEINGLVEGNPVYSAFLSPLEDGVYLRRGNAFSLRPCLWVFAGTKLEETMSQHSEKLSDFKSRMTMIKSIDFASLRSESKDKVEMENEARLEQVYLGASIIRKMYPDVQSVSFEVLKRFFDENPAESPARNISKRVAALSNVQYGRVTRKNCKMWETWENVHWPDIPDERLVNLVFDEQEFPRRGSIYGY